MDRIEWLKERRKGVGASDAYILMGQAPEWRTPLSLYEEKINTEEPVDEENFITNKGNLAEPKIRELVEDILGKKFMPALAQHPEIDYLRASLDGLSDDGKELLEIKIMGEKEWKKGIIPDKYMTQMQYQLAVQGGDVNYFAAYNYKELDTTKPLLKDNLILIKVEPDRVLQEKILKVVQNFWENHVLKRKPPKETDHDWVQVRDTENLCAKLVEAKNNIEIYKELEAKIKEEILHSVSHKRTIFGDLKVQRIDTKGSVVYKNIPELKGVDLDKYRGKGSSYWKISGTTKK